MKEAAGAKICTDGHDPGSGAVNMGSKRPALVSMWLTAELSSFVAAMSHVCTRQSSWGPCSSIPIIISNCQESRYVALTPVWTLFCRPLRFVAFVLNVLGLAKAGIAAVTMAKIASLMRDTIVKQSVVVLYVLIVRMIDGC